MVEFVFMLAFENVCFFLLSFKPMLTLYPSLHIKGGRSTYMPHSKPDNYRAEFLNKNPLELALEFKASGFPWLHIVDLDAAFSGTSENRETIKEIIRELKIPVQISGGIHSMPIVDAWIKDGANSVVITSAALTNPFLVREASTNFPGKIAVRIDSMEGYVASTGWVNSTGLKTLDLALRVEDEGAAKIIYAGINVEGKMTEVDLETTTDLAFALSIPLIAAGGVYSLQDLVELKTKKYAGIEGLILGRTLLNGILDPKKALALANS